MCVCVLSWGSYGAGTPVGMDNVKRDEGHVEYNYASLGDKCSTFAVEGFYLSLARRCFALATSPATTSHDRAEPETIVFIIHVRVCDSLANISIFIWQFVPLRSPCRSISQRYIHIKTRLVPSIISRWRLGVLECYPRASSYHACARLTQTGGPM